MIKVLSDDTIETITQSLLERSRQLHQLHIQGLTPNIRQAAQQDYDQTLKALKEIETSHYQIELKQHPNLITLADYEKYIITECLHKHLFNADKVSQELNISVRTVYRKINEYQIQDTKITVKNEHKRKRRS